MGKYKQEIIFSNESNKNKLVEKNKSLIIDRIKSFMDCHFDFNLKLHVIIKDFNSEINYVNKETDCGYSTWKKDGSFVICLSTESLRRIKYDQGLDLDTSIYHELCHIYDFYHVMNNKHYKINPLYLKQKNIKNYVIREGWNFWTEFFAYYFTFREFKEFHNYPTTHQIVVAYQKLIKQNNIIHTKIKEQEYGIQELCNKHIEDINQFKYALAKHLAGCIMGKRKYYKIKITEKNEKYVKEINKITQRLLKLISELIINTYGKGMARKLFNLGHYIIKTFYVKYDIIPIKHKGYIALAYCD